MRIKYSLLVMLILYSLVSAEVVYKKVEKDGSISYSDEEMPDSEKVYIPEDNQNQGIGGQATGYSPSSGSNNKKASPPLPTYTSLVIASPANETTVLPDQMTLAVSVSVLPGLVDGDQVAILLDGKEVSLGTELSHTLDNLYRGTHTLTAKVINSSGKTMINAAPVVFYVRRTIVRRSK